MEEECNMLEDRRSWKVLCNVQKEEWIICALNRAARPSLIGHTKGLEVHWERIKTGMINEIWISHDGFYIFQGLRMHMIREGPKVLPVSNICTILFWPNKSAFLHNWSYIFPGYWLLTPVLFPYLQFQRGRSNFLHKDL